MEATKVTTQMTPCDRPLPELEIPMINTMVTCLGSEHRKLDDHILQLAFAATTLASAPDALTANQRAVEAWDEIRRDLWSHLQVEDELVFSWGEAHHAISGTLLDILKVKHQEMRKLVAVSVVLWSLTDQIAAARIEAVLPWERVSGNYELRLGPLPFLSASDNQGPGCIS